MRIEYALLNNATAPLLTNKALESRDAFADLVNETSRQLARVLLKHVDKVQKELPGLGPGDEASLRNEVIERELATLKQLDPNQETGWKIIWTGPTLTSASCSRLYLGYGGTMAACDRVAAVVPEDEPDWDAEWQQKLATILVGVQAIHQRNQYFRIKKDLEKWRSDLLFEVGTKVPAPLGGVETYYGLERKPDKG